MVRRAVPACFSGRSGLQDDHPHQRRRLSSSNSLNFVDGDLLDDWFAATSAGIFQHGHVWQLLTATFLHADLCHILWNMLFLWMVGREMEAMYGTRDFLALYLSAAVISTLGWAVCRRTRAAGLHAHA